MSSLSNISQPFRLGLCAFTAAFLCATSARAEMKTQWVEYNHGEAKLKGYMAWDDSRTGQRPAVFMIHDKWGMSENTQKQAEQWSKLGYVVFAADILAMALLPQDRSRNQQADRHLPRRPRPDEGAYPGRLRHLLRTRWSTPPKVALDRLLLRRNRCRRVRRHRRAARRQSSSIHGSFHGHEPGWAQNLKGKFADPARRRGPDFSAQQLDLVIKELRAAKIPFEMELYSGTGHGFSTPKNKAEERANAEAIASATRTMKELFGI